jgi:hypothetical protein
MSPAPLSDEIYGVIAGTLDHPRSEVADMLGFSVSQVKVARHRIRSGWFPVKFGWTEDEDYIIASLPLATAREIAAMLPGRGWQAVKKRRSEIGALRGLPKHAFRADPMAPAGRTLVAKTCSSCGELRPGTAFRWRSPSKTWDSHCVYCGSDRVKSYRAKTGWSSSSGGARRQRVSLATAQRKGQEYTAADMAVLGNPTLTVLQKAVRTQHTYYGTSSAVARFGFTSALPALGDPEVDRWFIDNPNAQLPHAPHPEA